MSARTILTLANGRGIDLLNPQPEDIDWDAYAEHLAKEKRFNGATPGVEYSVAEHLSRGVDGMLAAGVERDAVVYFSIHDAPEGALKDDTTPKKQAIAELISARCGVVAPKILECFDELTGFHERAICMAAGLAYPVPHAIEERVKYWDLVMFVTEWRDLMHGVEHPDWEPYAQIPPLKDRIKPWTWETAKRALLRRWRELLPALRERPDERTQLAPHPRVALFNSNASKRTDYGRKRR